MSNEAKAIGERIRATRKTRKMSLQQLADAAQISKASLEKYEAGTRQPTSAAILALSKALRVGPERINGQPYWNGAEMEDSTQAVIPDLRRILLSYDSPEDLAAAPRPLEVLAAETEHVSRMRQDGKYVPMGPLLPTLLTELTHAALSAPEGELRERAYWWLARAYRAVNSLAHKLGYHDLSTAAIERVRWAAARSGDPYMVIIGDYLLLGAQLRHGAWVPARKLVVSLESRVARLVDGRWDDTSRGLLGSIVLKRAAADAKQGNYEAAVRGIEEAEEIAEASRGANGIYYETSFGPGNIGIHEVHIFKELGDPASAIRRADELGILDRLPEELPGERQSHHHIDLAEARLATGDRSGALASLMRAREIAPNHTRTHPTVRHTAEVLVRLDRNGDDTVAGFAHWTGAS